MVPKVNKFVYGVHSFPQDPEVPFDRNFLPAITVIAAQSQIPWILEHLPVNHTTTVQDFSTGSRTLPA